MGILKVQQIQNSAGDLAIDILADGSPIVSGTYAPGSVVLSTWDQSTRPTTGLFPGYIGYNTERRRIEMYDGIDPEDESPIWYGITTRVRFSSYDYTDTSVITTEGNMVDIAYLPMPNGPRTLLNYVTSFGLNESSSNNNNTSWANGHDVRPFEFRSTGSYFNSGNLAMFTGDGSSDSSDWVLFNFGNLGGGDFNPKWTGSQTGWAFFGGEFINQSASNNGLSLTKAYIWGFSDAVGWVKLWQEPTATTSGSWGHTNQNWYQSGGTVSSGDGKYAAYDNEPISYIGFSVR